MDYGIEVLITSKKRYEFKLKQRMESINRRTALEGSQIVYVNRIKDLEKCINCLEKQKKKTK